MKKYRCINDDIPKSPKGFFNNAHPHKDSDIHPCFCADYHYLFSSAVARECGREDISIHDRQMVWEQMRKRYKV